jgi:hypothetical protein
MTSMQLFERETSWIRSRVQTTASKRSTVSCCLYAFCKYLDAESWSHETTWTNASLQCYSNIYIQQDAKLYSLLYLETALHVSGGTSTHHQERIQLYLQHLVFVSPLLLPVAIAIWNILTIHGPMNVKFAVLVSCYVQYTGRDNRNASQL